MRQSLYCIKPSVRNVEDRSNSDNSLGLEGLPRNIRSELNDSNGGRFHNERVQTTLHFDFSIVDVAELVYWDDQKVCVVVAGQNKPLRCNE